MPKEYIARDAAIIGLAASSLTPHQIDDAAEAIQLVPAADVVEVVRCQDCVHWRGENDICKGIGVDFSADGYCSEGKRKNGGPDDG